LESTLLKEEGRQEGMAGWLWLIHYAWTMAGDLPWGKNGCARAGFPGPGTVSCSNPRSIGGAAHLLEPAKSSIVRAPSMPVSEGKIRLLPRIKEATTGEMHFPANFG